MRALCVVFLVVGLAGHPSDAFAQTDIAGAVGVGHGVEGDNYARGTLFDANVGGRAVWRADERLQIEVAGLVARQFVDEDYYDGDSLYLTSSSVYKLRATAGARYLLARGTDGQVYALAAAGAELRVSRWTAYVDSEASDMKRTDTSVAPVFVPALGARTRGPTHVGLQLALPIAYHQDDVVTLHGHDDGQLAVDVELTLLVGWRL